MSTLTDDECYYYFGYANEKVKNEFRSFLGNLQPWKQLLVVLCFQATISTKNTRL